MPQSYPDAIGYLQDLCTEVQLPWFQQICDIAITRPGTPLSDSDVKAIEETLHEKVPYATSLQHIPPIPAANTPLASVNLECISSFSNFKKLSDVLSLSFNPRVTLVFGTNGSGKSSIFECLRILGSPQPPLRPLNNLRKKIAAPTSFEYKLRGSTTSTTWATPAAYGPLATSLRFFDTSVAQNSIKAAIDPNRIVSVTPFRLGLFETVKDFAESVRASINKSILDNRHDLETRLDLIRTIFSDFPNRYLSQINAQSTQGLSGEIAAGATFSQHEAIPQISAKLKDLQRATSNEGLTLLRAELGQIEDACTQLERLLNSVDAVWNAKPADLKTEIERILHTQETLTGELLGAAADRTALSKLISAADAIVDFRRGGVNECPLCRQQLTEEALRLFASYGQLIHNSLAEQMSLLRSRQDRLKEQLLIIHDIDLSRIRRCSSLDDDIIAKTMTALAEIRLNFTLDANVDPAQLPGISMIKELATSLKSLGARKATTISTAATNQSTLQEEISAATITLESLTYLSTIKHHLSELKIVEQRQQELDFLTTITARFPSLFRKITETAKTAYSELVVADFEARLDAEYTTLTEKRMETFGVTLAKKGADAGVTLTPLVGGKAIDTVLSEGEQRVHSLALFFAELETSQHSTVVFDDPVSSFDYNYIGNFCNRLRDAIVRRPNRQFIILTHNWEFFVQLQSTLNKARLNNFISTQTLENCSSVAEYAEDIDKLKSSIVGILQTAGEPGKLEKEQLSGHMRRLIETIVNVLVFNRQRHQYKQKSQPVSDFGEFQKLIPLHATEATKFRDLYEKLSITEHDDPRNAYVSTDKATFQSRYDAILGIEAALIARKP